MDDSEDQFRELLAQLIARANRMLAEKSEVFPMGFLLMHDGRLEVSVGPYDSPDQIPSLLNAMQASLSARVSNGGVAASCIAYPDYSAEEIVAFLENHENYCAIARLPMAANPLSVDIDSVRVEDGSVYVFPIKD